MDIQEEKSEKEFVVTILLCLFLGGLGAHRFYTGKTGTAVVQLLTLGGFGIWSFIDLIMIILSKFKDSEGKVIRS